MIVLISTELSGIIFSVLFLIACIGLLIAGNHEN